MSESETVKKAKRALICEDNLTTATCIKLMLDKLGYESDIASDASTTTDLLNSKAYDFMTLDIVLPDKNGLELLDEIKSNEKTKDLPIIVVSATKPDSPNQNEKYVYWVEKSFDYGEFEGTVDKIAQEQAEKRLKVLHLEDDADVLTITEMTLEHFADVAKAQTVEEAEKLLQEDVFDIVILDYKLLDGTSEKIMDNIKNTKSKDAKMILFSAYEPDKSIRDKVDKVVMKSTVSSEEFLDHIKDFI